MAQRTGSTPRHHVGGRNLGAAIAVGVVLACVVAGSLLWRTEAFVLVVLALVVTAYVDAGRVLERAGERLLLVPLVASAPVLVVGTAVAPTSGQVVGLATLFGLCALAALGSRDGTHRLRRLSLTMLFGVWVGFLASYAVLLVLRDDGAALVLAVVAVTALADIGGYAIGVPFGRHKVAPRLSPNKSWEGLLGGLVAAAVGAALLLPLFGENFTMGSAIGFAVLCGLAGFAGDLLESMVKRDLGVKDLGELLPGHGGVLDRVDGILVAMPVAYYVAWFVG